jgi:hypothetical protein
MTKNARTQQPCSTEMIDADGNPLSVPTNLAGAFSDYFTFSLNLYPRRLPAFDKKRATVPPDEHVLDYLARAYALIDDDMGAITHPAGTVYVSCEPLPECVLCCDPARYDTLLAFQGRRTNGYACERCLRLHGDHTLDAAHTTYMMTADQVSPQVRAVLAEQYQRLGREPNWE